jgi:hypothetical protein
VGSARRKASTYTQNNTNTKLTHTDIHTLSGIRTHGPNVRASEGSSCLGLCGQCDPRTTLSETPKLEGVIRLDRVVTYISMPQISMLSEPKVVGPCDHAKQYTYMWSLLWLPADFGICGNFWKMLSLDTSHSACVEHKPVVTMVMPLIVLRSQHSLVMACETGLWEWGYVWEQRDARRLMVMQNTLKCQNNINPRSGDNILSVQHCYSSEFPEVIV